MKDLIKNRRTLAKVCRFTSLTGLSVGAGWLVVFSSSSISFPIEPLPSEQLHLTRAWVNAVLAAVVLCGGLCAMHIELSNSMRAAVELRTALENQQFDIFYQPQFNAGG